MAAYRIGWAFVVVPAAFVMVGCAGSVDLAPAADGPAVSPRDRGPDYPEIVQAVLRRFVERDATAHERGLDFYFVLDHVEQGDATKTVLAKFAGQKPAVVSATASSRGPDTVSHKELGGTGLLLLIGYFDRLDATTAEVGFGRAEVLDPIPIPVTYYRVERREGRWVATDVVATPAALVRAESRKRM